MATPLRGKAWVFDGIMDVDWEICPFPELKDAGVELGVWGRYDAIGQFAMIKVDPEFPKKVSRGDFIVAGENFGYGHDHDTGPKALKGAGVAAILCESAGPYFLRNSLDHGLPVVELAGIRNAVQQGDELELDVEKGYVRNLRTNANLSFTPFPSFILEMLDAGGIYPWIERQIKDGVLRPPSK
jgi:3-isopropylmalate/(R)-2-methylmalate dehydratase small subunit